MKHFFSLLLFLVPLASVSQNSCEDLTSKLHQGDLDGAIDLADQIIDSGNITCINLMGEVYLKKGRNTLAKSFFEKALSLAGNNSPEEADCFNYLGLVHWNMGNNNISWDYVFQALTIRQNLFGKNHEKTAASLNDLGLILSATNPDLALDYYEQALKIYQQLEGECREKIAQTKLNIGIIYRQLEFYGDAVLNFNDAIEIWQSIYPDGHPNVGFVYVNLGLTSLEKGNRSEAMQYYEKALPIYLRHYGEKHPEVAYVYHLIGNIHHSNEEFDEALSFYQKALISNSLNFSDPDPESNPPLDDIYHTNTLLSTLYSKAQAFMDRSIYKTLNFSDLKASLELLYVCDTLIDYIRIQTHNEADKIALGNSASNVYETGAFLCTVMANEAFSKNQYYEQSFYFAEKSKSAVLLEAIADASAKSFADIPDSELERENQLTADIAYYEQELAKKPNENLEKEYRSRLFERKQSYAAFISRLEKKFPNYYNLKYNSKVPSISEIQNVIDEETMVVSYFLTDATSRIFVYQITKDKYNVHNIPQQEEFQKYINGLKNSIRYQVFDLFQLTSESLYKTLFPFSIPKEVRKIVIIPNDKLGTVPFDVLLTKKSRSNAEDYTSLPYLVKDYGISYQFSAALFHQNKIPETSGEFKNAVFLCAPIHFKGIPDLPATGKEIDQLDEILVKKSLQPKKFTETAASESLIKSEKLSNYRYLHFATHGYVDENNPELSRLLLFENEESSEDGSLYSGEIYNLNLSAQLVTLSACETGLGKIAKGEGIIGLSRAFTYAGAENILVSLWVVSDESTAQLMIEFYDRMEEDNYSSALREAQLKLIGHPEYAKPYYWAPFILIGK